MAQGLARPRSIAARVVFEDCDAEPDTLDSYRMRSDVKLSPIPATRSIAAGPIDRFLRPGPGWRIGFRNGASASGFKAGFTDRVTRHLAPPCGLLWRVKYSLGGSPKLLNFKVRGFEPKLPLPARANFSGYAYDVLSAINIDLREERLPLAIIDLSKQ